MRSRRRDRSQRAPRLQRFGGDVHRRGSRAGSHHGPAARRPGRREALA